jgi:hypothetical protein
MGPLGLPVGAERVAGLPDHGRGFVDDALVGEPKGLEPGELEGDVALAIGLERVRAAVVPVAVELDDHRVLRPVAIDLEPLDDDVDRRPREPGLVTEP